MTMMSDAQLRKTIIGAVCFVIGACIISQVMMQLAGGPRDEPLTFDGRIPEEMNADEIEFEDGLPPFISSAGGFYPERAVFDAGIGIGGLLMIGFSFELFHRTKPTGDLRKFANICGLTTGVVIGFSMFNIIVYPFNTEFDMHIFWAMVIFIGAQIWALCLTIARSEIDADLKWKEWDLTKIRWFVFASIVVSFHLMLLLVYSGHYIIGAVFEWLLMFSSQSFLLTFVPTLGGAVLGEN